MSIEGGEGIHHAANFEGHVGQQRHCIPPEVELGRGRMVWVNDGHFVQRQRARLERIVGWKRLPVLHHDPWEGGPWRGLSLPSQRFAISREVHAVRVAEDVAVAFSESRVPNQLVVHHAPRVTFARPPGRKDGDHILDVASVEGVVHVVDQVTVGVLCGVALPGVDDLQGAPKVPANASVAVAPSQSCSEP